MMRKHVCYVLLFTLISFANGEKCIFETESGEKVACCADYEEKENVCVACSKGYTSDQGQNCRPCQKNTYGERCVHDCYCSASEICDIVEGCVIPSTGISEHETSNTTNLSRKLDETTTEKSAENRVQGLLSRDIITYYTLSLIVAVFGICVCFHFYKRKRVTEMKNSTIIKSTNRASPQNCQIMEMEEPAYDIIDDSNIQQIQMQIPPELHDVISRSNSTGSTESQKSVNLELPWQFLPSAETKRHGSKVDCSFSISDDNIPSSFEDNQETTKTLNNMSVSY